ncbi:MAG: PadR family transcriptional regulator [Pseudomonadota bacterium]
MSPVDFRVAPHSGFGKKTSSYALMFDISTIDVYTHCMTRTSAPPDLTSPEYWNNTIKMSLSKFFILCVLQDKELHGYDIAKEVERRTEGCCTPKEGTIYPVLKQFTEGGFVTCQSQVVSGRERKTYYVTDKGRQAFKVALGEWMKITRCLEECSNMAAE